MAVRLLLTDETWSEFESILLEVKRKVGRPPDLSDKMFIEAVLYIARTGIPWRDLPDEFGNWSAVYNQLRRWKTNGIIKQLWQRLGNNEMSLAKNNVSSI
ncbi:MAG: transposase [Candidatus Poribacteria bacterium]|nr:transposase [Candidatus Poribacteria bacterium]